MINEKILDEALSSVFAQITVLAAAVHVLVSQSPNKSEVVNAVNRVADLYDGSAGDHAKKISEIISIGVRSTSSLKTR